MMVVHSLPQTYPNAAHFETRFERLDILRAIAILWVFLFHALGTTLGRDTLPWGAFSRDYSAAPHEAFLLFYPYSWGPFGVILFFVISGFCIHWSFLRWIVRSGDRLGHWQTFVLPFYWRRFWRIYPPYLLALGIWSLVGGLDFSKWTDLKLFAVHAFLLHNLNEGHFFAIYGPFWSLAVEMQLYLVYPVVILAYRYLNFWGMLGLLLVSILLAFPASTSWLGGGNLEWAVRHLPFFYWAPWLAGALAAEVVARGIRPASWVPWLLGLSLVVAFAGIEIRALNMIALHVVYGLFAVAVWIFAMDQRPLGLVGRLLVPVGLSSYSLYMYHGLGIYEVHLLASPYHQWSPWWELTMGCLISFVACLAFAWVMYVLVEESSVKLGQRIAQWWKQRWATASRA